MEKIFPVKPLCVKYICDSCGITEMLPTGEIKIHEKYVSFIHKCKSCNTEKELMDKYPLIRYETI